MVYRALRSFSGVISMAAGEERELKDQYLIDSLLKPGYILPVREAGEDRGPLGDDDQPHAGANPHRGCGLTGLCPGKEGRKNEN